MKSTPTMLRTSGVLLLAALIMGCASTQTSNTQDKENMLIAAGFKVVTPKTDAQKQKLKALPAGKIAMITKSGKTYYVYPDAADNQAYVGGPTEYQAYQQARAAAKLSEENLEAATLYNDPMMSWDTWGGWGAGWGPMGIRRF